MGSVLRILFGVCLVLGLLTLGGCATGPTYPPSALPSLMETLRAGGNVIYMRHVTADIGRDVQGPGEWWKKCGEGHRMLSDKGRADAVQVGEAIRRLRIPISQYIAASIVGPWRPRAFFPSATPRPMPV